MNTQSAQKQSFVVDGYRLAYVTAGDPANPPLLMVHGWLSHSGIWANTIEALRGSYYCVAIDLLGMADSDKPNDAEYTIPAQARRVLALADHLGLQSFSLIGHSMGGQIVLYMASVLAPDRIHKVIDVDGVTTGRLYWYVERISIPYLRLGVGSPWLWKALRWLTNYPLVIHLQFWNFFYKLPPFESWALDREMALQPEMHLTAWRSVQGLQAMNLTEYLPKLRAPTLVIFGRQDKIVPPSEGEVVKGLVPNCQLVVFDQCGHFPMAEKAPEYLSAVKGFLAQASPT